MSATKRKRAFRLAQPVEALNRPNRLDDSIGSEMAGATLSGHLLNRCQAEPAGKITCASLQLLNNFQIGLGHYRPRLPMPVDNETGFPPEHSGQFQD
jgi:hypothetical protein